MSKIETIIFDWSGVISDDRQPVYEANMRILEANNIPRMEFTHFLEEAVGNAPRFLAQQGIEGTTEQLSTLYRTYFNQVVSSGITQKIYPDVKEVLEKLNNRRIRMAVLSSHPEENLIAESFEFQIQQHFELIVGSIIDKSQGLLNLIQRMKTYNAVYCGDTTHDVEAAKSQGILSAAISGNGEIPRGYHSKSKLLSVNPDFLLNSLTELLQLTTV